MRAIFLTIFCAGLVSSAFAQLGVGPTAPLPTPQPGLTGKRVCVADVANSSLKSVITDNLKERMVEDLQKEKINAYNAYLVTMLADRIGLTPENKKAAKRQRCDFVLLSEVANPTLTDISANHMKIDFALFKKGDWSKPVTSSSIPTAEADANNPTPVALDAVDKVIAQLVPTLKQK